MIPLYKNNYMRPVGTGENFKLEFTPLTTSFDNFYVESCRAAEELYELKQGSMNILYSGGIDSEYCLKVFMSLGMKVTPVIIKLNPGYNDHDTKYAFDFCSANNLTPTVIDFDFDKFVSSGKIFDVCKEMNSSTYGRVTTGYVAGLLDGTVIISDGDPYIKLDQNDNNWYFEEREHNYAPYNYFQKLGVHGTTTFICWTPGQMAAYMQDAIVQELANHEHPGKLSTNTSKHLIYNRHSNFDIQVRPKFHGFEKISIDERFRNSKAFKDMKEFGKSCNGFWRIPYHNFIEQYIKQDK